MELVGLCSGCIKISIATVVDTNFLALKGIHRQSRGPNLLCNDVMVRLLKYGDWVPTSQGFKFD